MDFYCVLNNALATQLVQKFLRHLDACPVVATDKQYLLFHNGCSISKGKHLVGFQGQFIKVIHPGNGATAQSRQTVGFHTNASEIKIAVKMVDLLNHVELVVADLFVMHSRRTSQSVLS